MASEKIRLQGGGIFSNADTGQHSIAHMGGFFYPTLSLPVPSGKFSSHKTLNFHIYYSIYLAANCPLTNIAISS
jgi:hypothetical protein